ncbi:hypothetical protein GCM10025762_38230 [Haloechinothrix salitolerans]
MREMSEGRGAAGPTAELTTAVSVHAVIARLLGEEFLLTLRHREQRWHMLPGGAIHSGETVCGGLRARLREVLGAEVGDLAFHTAIEDEPRPEGNHINLVFDTSLVGTDDVEVASRSDLWEAVWIRWDDIEAADLYPPLVRRRLPVGTLRDEAWWPPRLDSAPNGGED